MSALANVRRFLREAKYTLNGRRISELRADLQSANRRELGAAAFEIQDSILRLAAPITESGARLAVITCMPPAKTGIASASFLTYLKSPFPIDIFAHYESSEDYLCAISDRRLEGSNVRIFHIATLPLALRKSQYDGQLFVLGNSSENVPIYMQLRRMSSVPSLAPTFIHLHDPCMLNVLSLSCSAEKRDFEVVIEQHYGIRPPNDHDHDALVHAGIFGVGLLLQHFDIKGILVNSRAAQAIVKKECPSVRVDVLFHPVFSMVERRPKHSRSALCIGTFGEPNNGKRTSLVTAAFEIIRANDVTARLVIAGFGASRYAAQHRLTPKGGYEVYDDIDDEMLCQLMQSVDVAVQLRLNNLGETSGVVSRLMNTDIPIIVSKIGSFEDFGNCVTFFDEAGTPSQLVELILRLSKCGFDQASRRDYISDHSPKLFCEELADLIIRGA